jgi:hypothetical protein
MTVPRNVVPPNLPVALREYDQRGMEQFNNVLRLYFNQVSNRINSPTAHASYFDTTTQTNPVANQVNLFRYNSVVSEFGITRGVPTSKIFVSNTGVYNFQFSAQIDKTVAGVDQMWIWPRINGVNVPDSATKVNIQGNAEAEVAAWNFVLVMQAGDYFELAWQSPEDKMIILAEPAASNYPGIPSIILTVNWVSNYEANE